MASLCDNPILSTSRISPIIPSTFKDKKIVSTFIYRTVVFSFSQLSELFGKTDWSKPMDRLISTLSSQAWPWQLCLMVWCFCLSFQFLEYNFCTEFNGFMFMFILIWISISSFGTGEISNRWRYNDLGVTVSGRRSHFWLVNLNLPPRQIFFDARPI